MGEAHGRFIGVDLGASSGRVFAGLLDDDGLAMHELHRFDNEPITVDETLCWDIQRLFGQIKRGLAAFARAFGPEADGVGVDTWGVDFGLVGSDGSMLGHPAHYRDRRTEGMAEKVYARIDAGRLYEITGIQFLPFNTIFQLMSMVDAASPALQDAETLLFMPDLLNYLLTGRRVSEHTIASTSQMLDARGRDWSDAIVLALGLRREIMPPLVAPGSVVAPLDSGVGGEVGLSACPVIAPAGHDTASAVAAVPAEGRSRWAYISSGTWSLMGVELPEPLIDERAMAANFTNEAGVAGTVRFLKNIAGLWLMQQCRKVWQEQGVGCRYDQLTGEAERAEPFRSLVDPDDACFLDPPDMTEAITAFCARTNQPAPKTPGEFTRCIYESLALAYRRTLGTLEGLIGSRIEVLHVLGGGSRDALLCQATADACDVVVEAGPAEATSVGNVLMQAMAVGRISSLGQLREFSRRSSDLRRYRPQQTSAWERQAARFEALAGSRPSQ